METLIGILPIIVIVFFVLLLLKRSSRKKKIHQKNYFPKELSLEDKKDSIETEDLLKAYKPREHFFSRDEKKFYFGLNKAIAMLPKKHIVLSKVRLWDIVEVKPFSKGQWVAENKISSKHIDFVLIDYDLKVAVCIELDDSSHQMPDRTERDVFVNKLMKKVNIPLIRYPSKKFYEPEEIKDVIQNSLLKHTEKPL